MENQKDQEDEGTYSKKEGGGQGQTHTPVLVMMTIEDKIGAAEGNHKELKKDTITQLKTPEAKEVQHITKFHAFTVNQTVKDMITHIKVH